MGIPIEAVYSVLTLLNIIDLVPVREIGLEGLVDLEKTVSRASSQNQSKMPRSKLDIQYRLAVTDELLQAGPLVHLPWVVLALNAERVVLNLLTNNNLSII